ncbi:MAG: ComEC/Rec2 family competence protein [Clostridia bacterium]|nr:ComEC/Rec2 family competence protein [Clostridia bacterium]
MTPSQRAWLLPFASLCLIAGILLGRSCVSPLLPFLACVPALAAVLLLRSRPRFAACLVLSLTLGTAAGQMAWHPSLPAEGEYEIRGIISDEVRRGSFGQVRTTLADVALNGLPLSSGGYWTYYTEEEELPAELIPGREVCFRGTVYAPSGADNPDGYDFREELLRRGITVGLYGAEGLRVSIPSSFSFSGAAASIRHRLTQALVRTLGEEAGGYASALLLGNRSLIPSEDRAAFARLGIAHLLSVSGFHTGILVMLLSALFRMLRLRPSVRLVLCGFILLLYCGLCGMNQPVLRASFLLMLSLGGKLLNRPRVGLHLLCAVLFAMLLLSPVQLTGVSFQLSFGAFFGIVMIMPFLDRLNPFSGKIPRRLWSSAAMILAAQAGTFLPVLYHYQKLPLLSFLVNLPATAAATALILLDWIILILLPVPFLSGLLAVPAAAAASLFVRGVKALSDLPGVTLWIHSPTWLTVLGMLPVFYALSGLFRPSRLRRGLCLFGGMACVVFSLLPLPHTSTEYIQFSVGNADAAVLWDRDSVYVMDTGTEDGVLSGFLRRNRLTPDAVILTHLHTDHAGGLQSLLDDEIPIRLLYLPAGAEDQLIHEDMLGLLASLRASGTKIGILSRGDELSLPSGSLSVLWPESGRTRTNQDANDYSLVSLLRLNGVSFLQAGDLTGLYESYVAVSADLLKAAHHGSASSSSAEFLRRVDPRAVLLSCQRVTRHESFGARLGEIPLWSTAVHGALTVRFENGAFTITPYILPSDLESSDSGGM